MYTSADQGQIEKKEKKERKRERERERQTDRQRKQPYSLKITLYSVTFSYFPAFTYFCATQFQTHIVDCNKVGLLHLQSSAASTVQTSGGRSSYPTTVNDQLRIKLDDATITIQNTILQIHHRVLLNLQSDSGSFLRK